MIDANRSGTVENDTNPLTAYLKSEKNENFVCPAARTMFGNSTHFVVKPTHWNSPFVNRSVSPSEITASSIFRVIMRKSVALGFISTDDMEFNKP